MALTENWTKEWKFKNYSETGIKRIPKTKSDFTYVCSLLMSERMIVNLSVNDWESVHSDVLCNLSSSWESVHSDVLCDLSSSFCRYLNIESFIVKETEDGISSDSQFIESKVWIYNDPLNNFFRLRMRDHNFFLENRLFSFVVSNKRIFALKHIGYCQELTLFKLIRRRYLPHFWSEKGFNGLGVFEYIYISW